MSMSVYGLCCLPEKNCRVRQHKPFFIILILAALLMVLFLFSFILGHYDVPLEEVVRILLTGQSDDPKMLAAVINIRMPRIVMACLVGCALSAAGTSFQAVFQNPMASPDILGSSSGACFGAALAILFNFSRTGVTFSAFFFSLGGIALVYLIGRASRRNRIVAILLAGMMISSLFSAGTSYIKLVADPNNQLPAITYWMMGSLSGTRKSDIQFVIWPMLIGLIPLLLLRWRINLLTVSEDEAETMGVNVGLLRLAVILCASLLTASAVSVSGMIGWVGLVIPHLSRKLAGNDCRWLYPTVMFFGAFFLLLVDNVSRNLLLVEIPIGILTAFIGAPFFIFLMTRKESGI